jgi:antitoxin component of RelBE/YafQ-DinJ toxin-antitoxin module
MANKSTTVRLSTEDLALREALSEHLGVTGAGIIRMALRKLARAEGVPVPERALPTHHPKKKRAGSR